MSSRLMAALRKLRQCTGGILPGSQLTEPQRHELERFAQATGCIKMKPQGRGVVFEIILPAVADHHWRQLVPVDPDELEENLPNRARNIATTRSSKGRSHGHTFSYLLLKAGAGQVDWLDSHGNRLDLRTTTDQLGAAALAVQSGNTWRTEHPLWLVENQALFDQLDWLPSNEPASVAYYSGQLTNALIDWLAEHRRTPSINFFPDYDGVGLLNYARIRAKLGVTARLWLMPNWQERLARFGNDTIWKDTQREFNAMLAHPASAEFEEPVKQLIGHMQKAGLALEQETVWLDY